ncbi:winged helix-turn-helix domain-containing protein [Streptomyces sp. 8N706]|uniref:winged helix-turn-helix domain-containing protein n=1 Tax=Streptomyces sp. 8N706 TaxID=3457416 RepID=UPI003FD25AE9
MAQAPRPFLEVGMALWMLRQPACTARFDAWQREAFKQLAPPIRKLAAQHPQIGHSPDFVWTPTSAETPRDALEIVSAVPLRQVQDLVTRLARRNQKAPDWKRRLCEDRGALAQYNGMLHSVHEQVIKPYWPKIDKLASAERAQHMQRLTEGGVDSMLAGLDPRRIRWSPPVLELAFPGQLDVHLGGRGLLLIPTLFGGDPFLGVDPFNVEDTEPQRWLSFSIHRGEQPLTTQGPAPSGAPQSLSALLGRTRAAVLCAIAEHPNCNTTQLARRVAIATASASEHATVLRSAGLTAAARHHNMMLHTLTAAGHSLLSAST